MNEPFLDGNIDIDENTILRNSPEILKILLRDRTTGKNIIWATKTYELLGKEFEAREPIKLKLITGNNSSLIRPRIEKLKYEQKERTKGKAEVFTPIWIVEKQNNIIDQEFKDLDLKEYVSKVWLEIACGEAPYMVTRYNSVTGEFLPIQERVGFIDKKLKRISKEIEEEQEWFEYAKIAYQTSFGYEFQGDSLLIARENLLYTFFDYYIAKFSIKPDIQFQKEIARIISYNVFQMDGLNYTIPYSGEQNQKKVSEQLDLFGDLKIAEEYVSDMSKTNILAKIRYMKNKKMIEFQAFSKEETLMKFDVIIGNPPYQEEAMETSDKPIYNIFLEEAYKIADRAIFITPARFLFNAGKTPKKWNEKMLSDNHLRVMFFEQNSSKVFPNTDIKGGVAVTYRNITESYESIGTFTIYDELNSILHKVPVLDSLNFSSLVYSPESYKLTQCLYDEHPEIKTMTKINKKGRRVSLISSGHEFDMTTNVFDNLPFIFFEDKPENKYEYIRIYGRQDNKRILKWVKKKYIKNHENLEKWKIFLPKANGSGKFGEVLSNPIIGEPFVGTNQSFISIGAFESNFEANSTLKYIKTKFLRSLLGVLKVTQDNKKATWSKIPIQDFTSNSDIDWSKSIPEIDQQLYKKYNLNEVEINFIETRVKEME